VQENSAFDPDPARVPGHRAASGRLPYYGGSGPGHLQDGPGHNEGRERRYTSIDAIRGVAQLAPSTSLTGHHGPISRPVSLSAFLCDIGHRQDTRCRAMDQRHCFNMVRQCRSRNFREIMTWNAYAWRQSASSWRTTFAIPLCCRISFGWPRHGPAWRIKGRARSPRLGIDLNPGYLGLRDQHPVGSHLSLRPFVLP
jgi:hypothetical protein